MLQITDLRGNVRLGRGAAHLGEAGGFDAVDLEDEVEGAVRILAVGDDRISCEESRRDALTERSEEKQLTLRFAPEPDCVFGKFHVLSGPWTSA